MIKLLIDGQEVALSEGGSYEYYTRNPIFTKEGQFTYDLDIDLSYPENAVIYKHIYRKDMNDAPKNRPAVLYDGPLVLIRGTEVVLGVDDKTAKIQIVGGNSELNYISGGKMRDLDFGSIGLTLENARASLSASYPEFNYVCCPVLYNSVYYPMGGYTDSSYYNQVETQGTQQSPITRDDAKLRAQPYLLFYIEKTVELLGYTLKGNVLRDAPTCQLICVNGLETDLYADILPDWTVEEFISYIEQMFNVLFIVNQSDKSVDIVRTPDFYRERGFEFVSPDKVIDTVEKNYDRDEELYTNYYNVRYAAPSGLDYYQFADVDPEIIKLCEIRENNLLFAEMDQSTVNKMIIYREQKFGNYQIYRHYSDGNVSSTFYQHLMYLQRVVNRPDDDNFVELQIIPAEINIREDGDNRLFTVPLARNSLDTSATEEIKQGLVDFITEGIQQKQAPDHLFVAFYVGYQTYFLPVLNPDTGEQYRADGMGRIPMCRTLHAHCSVHLAQDPWFYVVFPDRDVTLQLDGEHGLYNRWYEHNETFNTSTEFKIRFVCRYKPLSPMDIYVIDNKKYMCKELKHTFDTASLSDVVEGTFYLME